MFKNYATGCIIYLYNGVWLGASLTWVSRQDLPVVKHTLREGLSSSVGTQVSGESEGLVDRQVGLYHEHWSSGNLGLFEYVSTTTVEYSVDTTHGYFGTLQML